MHVLLIQHGAYYGISARCINDVTAESVRGKLNANTALVKQRDRDTWLDLKGEYAIHLLEVDEDLNTFGFDTGKMKEGFEAIDQILEDV